LNAAKVMLSRLSDKQKKKLTIAQIDARIPHREDADDINWRKIKQVFSGHLTLDPYNAMQENGETPDDIASNYSARLEMLMEKADKTIGLYGIGKDGHIAGMLPGRAAYNFTRFLDGRHVVKYRPKDYLRITTTQEVLVSLDKVVVLVCGKEKHRAVADLDKDILPHIHPAQLLKDVKKAEAHINVGR